jgi:hypothetical protein
MRDCTAMVNRAGEHAATIGFNESCGLWQIVIARCKEIEVFCPRELAFAARRNEFDPETGFLRSNLPAYSMLNRVVDR